MLILKIILHKDVKNSIKLMASDRYQFENKIK